jgi:hypothetical protein
MANSYYLNSEKIKLPSVEIPEYAVRFYPASAASPLPQATSSFQHPSRETKFVDQVIVAKNTLGSMKPTD